MNTLQFRAQMVTSTALTPAQLVQNVLLGSGITATNITFTGSPTAIGKFTIPSSSGLGIDSGLVLTTGTVLNNGSGPHGPNNSGSAGQDNFLPGDPYLTNIVGAAIGTNDASVLEFDFVPQSDTVKFNYVFGSEEYNDFVSSGGTGGVNDVFAFILSGVSTPLPATNIALIPNTTTPIAIFNVNNGYSITGMQGTGPCMNCSYYRDNYNGVIDVQYDGLTVKLTAKHPVICGETYHIKIAIADASDGVWDSGVFLEAGSFTTSTPISITSDIQSTSNDSVLYEGCASASIIFTRPLNTAGVADTFNYVITGTAVNGTDYAPMSTQIIFPVGVDTVVVPVSVIADGVPEGIETLTITLTQQINICGALQTISFDLYINDLNPMQNIPIDDSLICFGSTINLNELVTGGSDTYFHSWTANGVPIGLNSDSIVVSPIVNTTYVFSSTSLCSTDTLRDTIVVTVAPGNYITGHFDVINNTIDSVLTEGCGQADLIFNRLGSNLGIAESYPIIISATATNPADYTTVIPSTINFAANQTNVTISNITAIADGLPEGIEQIMITIPIPTSALCAPQIAQTFFLNIHDLSPLVVLATDTTICAGQSVSISAAATGGGMPYVYTWSSGLGSGVSQVVSPATTTSYTVTLSDNCGSQPVTDVATVTVLTDTVKVSLLNDLEACINKNVSIPHIVTGGYAPYTLDWTTILGNDSAFVLNNSNSQLYQLTTGGTLVLTVRDKCNKIDSDTINIIAKSCDIIVPNVVTPNGDNRNDVLVIRNLENYPNSQIFIYDRWGLLVYSDANYQNNWTPSGLSDGVYFLVLILPDGTSVSGYFHLFH